MPRTKDIDESAETAASPSTVYALLRDGSTWPAWSPIDSFELAEPATDEPEGVGAVRHFRTGGVDSRDQIVELLPDRRFSHTLVDGPPLNDYRADIDITPLPGGCRIRWHATYTAGRFGTGWFRHRRLRESIAASVRGLAAHAARVEH
ncbi:SRPBCC family protein [Phytomonospora sp. NPDC050363]|uniref:SRPBCC family protein n=1 Tax=Phytomonospora sp. NPDC050363 TaxID=3155642 RepID=UPI0033E86090